MRKPRGIVAALAGAVVVGAGLFTFSLRSSDNSTSYCNTPVYAGNSTVRADDERLLNAIKAVEAEDVTVRVVVIDSVEGKSHEQWLKDAVSKCQNWYDASTDTGLAPRYLVVVVSTEDQLTDTYVGTSLTVRISERDEEFIRNNVMNPEFGATQGNNLNPGLIAGLQAFHEELTAPLTQPNTDNNSGGGEPSGQQTSKDEEPVDIPWGVIGWVALGLIVLALLIFALSAFRRMLEDRRAKREQYEAAQQAAESAVAKAKAASEQIILDDSFSQRLKSLMEQLGLGDGSETSTMLSSGDHLKIKLGQISSSHLGLTPATTPTTTGEWHRLEQDASDFMVDIQEFLEEFDAFAKQANEYSGLVTTRETRSAEVRRRLAELDLSLDNSREQGWKTGHLDAEFNGVDGRIATAERCFVGGQFNAGHEHLNAAMSVMDNLEAEVAALPTLGDDLLKSMKALAKRLEDLRIKQGKTEGLYDQMLAEFGLDNLKSIENFGSEADILLDECEVDIPSIAGLVSKEIQDYAGARNLIDELDQMLNQAEALYQEVSDLDKNLKRMRDKAGRLATDVQKKLDKAIKFCEDHLADVGQDELDALRPLNGRLIATRTELVQPHPAYLRIVEDLETMAGQIKEYHDDAEDEHAAADAERTRLADAEREAKAASKELDDYIQNHKRDIDAERLNELKRLRNEHRHDSGLSLAERIIIWQQYEKAVEGLHKKCKSDVSDAVEARRPTYSSRSSWDSDDSSTGGSRSSFDFGGISTGGGRSSFGSFGGGGVKTGGGRSGW